MEIQHYIWLGTPNLVCTGEIVQMTQNQNLIPICTIRCQTATVRLTLHVFSLQKRTYVDIPARLVMVNIKGKHQRYANADLKISPYIQIQMKILPWKLCIPNRKNSRPIHPWRAYRNPWTQDAITGRRTKNARPQTPNTRPRTLEADTNSGRQMQDCGR